MQNIDFRTPNRAFVPSAAKVRSAPSSKVPKHRFSFVFVGMILFFTVGLFAGIKIGKLQKIEKSDCIVRYPQETESLARMPPASGQREKAKTSVQLANTSEEMNYIIKVGEFDATTAQRLSRQLNSLPELRSLRPLFCKDVQENEGRPPAFRMKAQTASDKENVLVGCFQDAAQANHILNTIKRSGLPGSSRAKLYEY